MDPSLRSYWTLAAVLELSLGSMSYTAPWWSTFDPEDPTALFGSAVLGTLFLFVAFGSVVTLLADAIRRWRLSTMDFAQLRGRLQQTDRSYRYVAKQTHLRGMKIGAAFFGLLFLFTIGIHVLNYIGLIEIPG